MLGQNLEPVQIADLVAAERRLRGVFPPSPLLSMAHMNQKLGRPVFLKAESLLPSGAYKFRGATNKITTLMETYGPEIGIITASSGNHGMACALAASRLGISAAVVVPVPTPQIKKDSIRALGAQLVEVGETYDESFLAACEMAEKERRFYVHPVSDRYTVAGQGTITLESRWSTSVQWRNGAFRNRTDVTAVVLPEGLQAIGEQAFRGCTALTSVTLPEGVRSIGSLAFQGCTALEELDLPSTATKLDWGCFSNCTALRRVSLSKRLKTLPQLAFQGCTSLPSVELPRGLVKIEGSAFAGCTALTEVAIPGQVLEVGQNAFFRCTALERLTLGEKLRDCSEAFQECFSLAEVVLPGSVQNFTRAFQRCGLKSVTLCEGIEAVGAGAFAFCSDLTRVHLPESLRRIEDGAFARCTALPAIAIPAGVKFVGEAAFLGCDALFSGLLDPSVTSDYNISASYDLRDGSWHTWTITGYHGPDTDITVPSEVAGKPIARIAPEAFAGYTSESCAQLRRVVLPHGIRELYPLTFKDCKHLEEVVLPDTLEELSQGVFDGCDALHKLTIPPSVTYFHLQAIPDRAGLTLCVEPSSAAYGFAKANWENVSLQLPAADPASLTIAGKTFVLTGDFTHCGGDRDAVKALIEEKGGRCTGSVSGKTSYLVLGDAGGAGDKKIQKAKDLQAEGKDLRIISESDLFQVL